MDNLARDPERFSQPQDDNTGETTLHILSKEGKVEIIETLLNDERMEDHMVSEVLTNDLSYGTVHLWPYGLSSVQVGGTKLERFLPKNQHTQRKLLNFENWCNGEATKSAKFDFQSQFSISKIIQNFLNFFIY